MPLLVVLSSRGNWGLSGLAWADVCRGQDGPQGKRGWLFSWATAQRRNGKMIMSWHLYSESRHPNATALGRTLPGTGNQGASIGNSRAWPGEDVRVINKNSTHTVPSARYPVSRQGCSWSAGTRHETSWVVGTLLAPGNGRLQWYGTEHVGARRCKRASASARNESTWAGWHPHKSR